MVALQSPPPNSVSSSIFKFLEKYQAQELILPFLITFVIVYGVLDTVKIFHKNSINGIIAISVSFFAIFYGPYGAMGKFLTQLYGTGAIAVIGIVLLMIVLGALSLGGNRQNYNQGIFERLFGQSGGMIVGFVITIVLMFLLATGWFENVGLKLDSDTTALIIIILVILLLFYLLTRSPDKYKQWWKGWQGTFGPPPH